MIIQIPMKTTTKCVWPGVCLRKASKEADSERVTREIITQNTTKND